MSCPVCTDPDGDVLVPYYGTAPHSHRGVVSVTLPRGQWPPNFLEDTESPGHGIWWCAACGEGKPEDVE